MALTRTEIQKRYDDKNRKNYTFKLNINYDSDIIEKLASVESIQGYIKECIRKDIKAAEKAAE